MYPRQERPSPGPGQRLSVEAPPAMAMVDPAEVPTCLVVLLSFLLVQEWHLQAGSGTGELGDGLRWAATLSGH